MGLLLGLGLRRDRVGVRVRGLLFWGLGLGFWLGDVLGICYCDARDCVVGDRVPYSLHIPVYLLTCTLILAGIGDVPMKSGC